MNLSIKILFIVISIANLNASKAESLLLIHGYLSNTNTWLNSGVISELEKDQWRNNGAYLIKADGSLYLKEFSGADSGKNIFVLDLPSEAPMQLQGSLVAKVIKTIESKYPKENITIIGHSAGGLAARIALVNFPTKHVVRLITIATPHLGTDMAEKALELSTFTGPATLLPGIFGGDLARTNQRSKQFYKDLERQKPGNFLDWLNHQKHPDIIWDSIIHTGRSNSGNDDYVDAYSQDMNRVAALKDKSSVITLAVEHELNHRDAVLLRTMLAKPKTE